MLSTCIETDLPCEIALKRIRQGFPSLGRKDPAARVHGCVEGCRFWGRVGHTARSGLHGTLEGVVEPRDEGATVRARAAGAHGVAILAGASLAAAFYFAILLRSTEDSAARVLFMTLSACCLGGSLYSIATVVAEWRRLMGHLHDLFPDAAA